MSEGPKKTKILEGPPYSIYFERQSQNSIQIEDLSFQETATFLLAKIFQILALGNISFLIIFP